MMDCPPEFIVPSICPDCKGAAVDNVWFDDATGAPASNLVCPTCTVPPTADPSPAMIAVGEFWDDPDDDEYSEEIA
jgi:hypothetical protein